MTNTTKYAAVSNNEMEPIVWGLGDSPDEAIADANAQMDDGDITGSRDWDVCQISPEAVELVEEGTVICRASWQVPHGPRTLIIDTRRRTVTT